MTITARNIRRDHDNYMLLSLIVRSRRKVYTRLLFIAFLLTFVVVMMWWSISITEDRMPSVVHRMPVSPSTSNKSFYVIKRPNYQQHSNDKHKEVLSPNLKGDSMYVTPSTEKDSGKENGASKNGGNFLGNNEKKIERYSTVHCIDGTMNSDITQKNKVSSDYSGVSLPSDSGILLMEPSDSARYTPPFTAYSHDYGFNVVNRSCFFTNVLFRAPKQFTIFLRDTPRNRKLKDEGLLVPPVALASRPFDITNSRSEARLRGEYDWRPNIVLGPLPELEMEEKSKSGVSEQASSNTLHSDNKILGYYSPIVAPWNYAHTLFGDLLGLFWAAYEFTTMNDVTPTEKLASQSSYYPPQWQWTVDEITGEGARFFSAPKSASLFDNLKLSSPVDSDGSVIANIETLTLKGIKKLFNASQSLLSAVGKVSQGSGCCNDGSMRRQPLLDLQIVLSGKIYRRAFALPNNNKAFEMFSRAGFSSTDINGTTSKSTLSPYSNDNKERVIIGEGQRRPKTPLVSSTSPVAGKAIYDTDLRDNTIYRGLLVGTGTKSWSWVTNQYAASGSSVFWGKFRKHLIDVTGAVDKEEEDTNPDGGASVHKPSNEGNINNINNLNNNEDPMMKESDVLSRRKNKKLRVSICYKKDKRGIVNYEEVVKWLSNHFNKALEGRIEFVLESAVGRHVREQVQMMIDSDVYLCNEGTLATNLFLLPPKSVFISLPLVYHGPHLHINKMPDPKEWWRLPDLVRPDPRLNIGGNIDWFPQVIPWVRTFWYDNVPLNETKIQLPLSNLRNYMPDYNHELQEKRIIPLLEKVLGYLLAVGNIRAEGVYNKEDINTTSEEGKAILRRVDMWREVFNNRARYLSVANTNTNTDGQHDNRHSSINGAKVTNARMSMTEVYTTLYLLDKDHNYSLTGRICRHILKAFSEWTRAFNSARCYYGMSWLCEYWSNTYFPSRGLHGKWAKSKGNCGDISTTLARANQHLTELANSSNSNSDSSFGPKKNAIYIDPRVTAMSTGTTTLPKVFADGNDKDEIIKQLALSPLLFSASHTYDREYRKFSVITVPPIPRPLKEFLFFDPRDIIPTYSKTNIAIPPMSITAINEIFYTDNSNSSNASQTMFSEKL